MYNEEIKPLSYEETKDKALTFLEYRAHSEKEISDKLRRKGANSENIEKTMLFLREYKLIDDEDYARRLSNDLSKIKKYGKHRIKSELYKRGIDSEIIDFVISNMNSDEEEKLLPLIQKRLRDDFEKKNIDKVTRYFIYRGYSFSDIRRCIDLIKDEQSF